MNALYLKDVAAKTRRGLRGRVEAGKSGGGISYGYRVVRSVDGLKQDERELDQSQAEIVRTIFRRYADGSSPEHIAQRLNREKVPGPARGPWSPSRCGVCGGGFQVYSHDYLGCFSARDGGTCANRLTIKRAEVEQRVLAALPYKLLEKELFKAGSPLGPRYEWTFCVWLLRLDSNRQPSGWIRFDCLDDRRSTAVTNTSWSASRRQFFTNIEPIATSADVRLSSKRDSELAVMSRLALVVENS